MEEWKRKLGCECEILPLNVGISSPRVVEGRVLRSKLVELESWSRQSRQASNQSGFQSSTRLEYTKIWHCSSSKGGNRTFYLKTSKPNIKTNTVPCTPSHSQTTLPKLPLVSI
jgi:hypothetical protein